MTFSIKERGTEALIAEGEPNETVRKFEGNWYFKPETVDMTRLTKTERTYRCPYKGIAQWFDLETPDGQVHRNVAWVYHQPKSGYEYIADEIGFYAHNTSGTLAVNSDPTRSPFAPLAALIKKILPL